MWLKSKINNLSFLLGFIALTPFTSLGQSAQELFHKAASEYTVGKASVAKNMALEALEKYPNDQKLQSLLEKMNEEKDQQNQKNQQNKEDEENKQEDQNKPQNNDQKDSPEKQEQSDQQKQSEDGKDQKEKPEQSKEGQPQKGQISREDAQRLLKALERDEEDLQKKLMKKKVKSEPNPSQKDW